MASFEIADCPTALPLVETPGSGGSVQKAALTLTIRNQTEQSHGARIAIETEGAAKPDWFAFDGALPTSPREIERDFSSKGTSTVKVNVAVPAGEAPAKHVFRVKVTAEDDPDNDVKLSPNVAFEVAPWSMAPPPPRESFPWWAIVVAVVLLLVVAGAVVYLIWFREEPVGPPPPVQGFTLNCRGGPGMQVTTADDRSLRIPFAPTAQGTGIVPPQPGQCGWVDRGFRPGEPPVLQVVREVVGSGGLAATIQSGQPFQVTAYNGGGVMVVTKIGP